MKKLNACDLMFPSEKPIFSSESYELAELGRFHNEALAIEKGPLADRKEGRELLIDTLTNSLEHWLECVQFLLSGDYGAGAQFAFKRQSKRSNRRAFLFNTIAVLEYRTSVKYACDVWHALPTDLQNTIDRELDSLIHAFDSEEK